MAARLRSRFNRPWLYRKQLEALYDPARYSLIEASTKSGKTVGAIVWLIEQALTGSRGNYWWVAPPTARPKSRTVASGTAYRCPSATR